MVIPAAGTGSRMGAALPKQYLPLKGKTVLEHTLARFCGHPAVRGIVVALAEHDPHWDGLQARCDCPLWRAAGGAERCHSVLSGLEILGDRADADDWVLVHDAARPCLHRDDLDRLIDQLREHPVGGLLAMPVRDTMKRADDQGDVITTVDRQGLWHALTPQMFRLGALREALRAALAAGVTVTDEAAAMERTGELPHLVEGRADNIKITRAEDLALAQFYLEQQESERP